MTGSTLRHARVGLYALMLSAAGIPLYIHLPQFATVHLGLGLSGLGVLLLAIRLVDLLQDPLIGWAIDRWPRAQAAFALAAALGLAIGFPALFLMEPGPALMARLVAVLVLLFTAYSLGTILLYARSATLADSPEPPALMRLAAWREGGTLAGVILAAMLPGLLAALGASAAGYPAFGLALGALCLTVAGLTLPLWRRRPLPSAPLSIRGMGEAGAVRLLVLALVNSLPVAITSTLFLFFVEDRLQAQGMAGPLLVLFFASAGISLPVWARISRRIGARGTLFLSMSLALAGFVGAALLGPGDVAPFAAICIATGAAMGAEAMLLPALFSVALTRAGLNPALAFGIWTFAGKVGLALAAFLVMPLLQWQGYEPGQANSPDALTALGLTYAALPCLLKLAALAMVAKLPRD